MSWGGHAAAGRAVDRLIRPRSIGTCRPEAQSVASAVQSGAAAAHIANGGYGADEWSSSRSTEHAARPSKRSEGRLYDLFQNSKRTPGTIGLKDYLSTADGCPITATRRCRKLPPGTVRQS